MGRLVARATDPGSEPGGGVEEVILALSATVDGQTTAHYISERLAGSVGAGSEGAGSGVKVSRLAHGVPVGGELDYLDDGTLTAAMKARRPACCQFGLMPIRVKALPQPARSEEHQDGKGVIDQGKHGG